MKNKILFICVHNSARSQMAAAFVNHLCGDFFEAQSAGLDPGRLNPIVVEALQEIGIDISQKETQAVFDVWKSGVLFSHVVTVCSEAEAAGCPIVPGPAIRQHWPFEDPSKFTGTDTERLAETRRVRDEIRARVARFCAEQCISSPAAGTR